VSPIRIEDVYLLPGLWMPRTTMVVLARRLSRLGYRTMTVDYPSVRCGLDENADRIAAVLARGGRRTCAIVAHSTGGIVALRAALRTSGTTPARIVLLGTPFADVYAARSLWHHRFWRRVIGRTIGDWVAAQTRPVPPDIELGVLAGDRRFGLGSVFVRDMPRPNDGVVTVAETHVPGMRDHRVMPVTHMALVTDRRVCREVDAFLATGRFLPPGAAP
jgi:pimeloyl-ACP methyl ester carboxylesterase